jgi:hypothetical protein
MDHRRFVPGLTLAIAASAATAGSALLFHTAGVQAVADAPARPPAPDVSLRSIVQLDADVSPTAPVVLPPRIEADPVVAAAPDRSESRQAPVPQPDQPATRDLLAKPAEPAPLEEPPPIVEQPQADNNVPVELPPGEAPPTEDDDAAPLVARDASKPPLELGGAKTGTPPREH